MAYVNDLIRLLRPLGVYSFQNGSFSRGELEALGDSLDTAEAWEKALQKETILPLAEADGLSLREALFPIITTGLSLEQKREALAAFFRIGNGDFTLQALSACLAACSVSCLLEETSTVNQVRISFPGVMGVPENFARTKALAERILPCQLEIVWFFRYCTWAETEQYGLTWQDLGDMTWYEWMIYTE